MSSKKPPVEEVAVLEPGSADRSLREATLGRLREMAKAKNSDDCKNAKLVADAIEAEELLFRAAEEVGGLERSLIVVANFHNLATLRARFGSVAAEDFTARAEVPFPLDLQ